VCCRVLQCVAVLHSRGAAARSSYRDHMVYILVCVAACCSVLQCVAVMCESV